MDDAEIVPALPADPWDVAVDVVVRESRTVACNGRPPRNRPAADGR